MRLKEMMHASGAEIKNLKSKLIAINRENDELEEKITRGYEEYVIPKLYETFYVYEENLLP